MMCVAFARACDVEEDEMALVRCRSKKLLGAKLFKAEGGRADSTSAFSCACRSSIVFSHTTLDMETLDKTEWDVVIVGTGVTQSLLALYGSPTRTAQASAD